MKKMINDKQEGFSYDYRDEVWWDRLLGVLCHSVLTITRKSGRDKQYDKEEIAKNRQSKRIMLNDNHEWINSMIKRKLLEIDRV